MSKGGESIRLIKKKRKKKEKERFNFLEKVKESNPMRNIIKNIMKGYKIYNSS